ncbi:Protein kinase C-like, phorbol ester/diacylglycerol binding protein [Corchorus olitorius]|uniref:Protein kinase C-like, phorbol ester/diacylglycerol binding protein n=1 Tax=Corchorus olitorius TaxID=93759 RepID=A0A1R3KEL8_9ROSI|nr:Protein kinase C-like, phorbol ester/diacylglycerol binding protein [Corchorus olitorius]
MEWEKEIEGVLHLRHKFHEHALALVDINQSEEKDAAYCQGCGQVVSGPCFSCANSDCNYHLHQKCARHNDCFYIDNHSLHKHSMFHLKERPKHDHPGYACALCREKSNVFFYECGSCYFFLDINCALFLNKHFFYQSKDEAHQFAFILFENHNDKLKTVACSWCHEPLADSSSTYISAECKYYLHKSCFDQLPTQIDHPCHSIHPLILEFDNKNRFCKLCQKGDDKHFFYYHCFACNFDIHLECIWPRPVIEDKKYHEHPFTLLWRRDSFTCDACGTEGKFVSYVCCTCHIHAHDKCASLPRTIKITRHDHRLVHKYFFKKGEFEKHDCQVCFDPVKTEYGHYHCLKADQCNYVVHVECAIGDPNLHEVIDEENPESNLDQDMDCSSFRVIEQNRDGEATKIRHFLHDEDEHDLVLEMKQEDIHDSRCCEGCVVSLSISADLFYYSCLKCDFVLHKGCAVLPKEKHHWYHRSVTTLQSVQLVNNSYFNCHLCRHRCTGFYYQSSGKDQMKLCLRCAQIPNIITSGHVHKHKVFFDHKCRGQCNACGRSINKIGAFRCKECSFTLDFACVTLPPTIEHKSVCDQHLLQLAYGEESKEEEAYCDICETKRDPRHWYYHCAICDTCAHPKCVLGNYPFIKTATPHRDIYCNNHHRLSFARKKIYEYPPQCSRCGKHCQDLFLACAPCNYIQHSFVCP